MDYISPEHLADRRRTLMEQIGPDAVAVFVANRVAHRSRDTDYPYRASSDILYLSGFDEPEAVLVLAPGHDEGEFALFVRPRDPEKERWDGNRCGVEGAKSRFAADAAFSVDEIETQLPRYLQDRETLYYTLGQHPEFDARVAAWMHSLRYRRNEPPAAPRQIVDARDVVHEMRLFKRPEEIDVMRRAAEISSQAHVDAMKACRPGMFEYELQAIIEHRFRSSGATYPAYTSIVGAGDNATILHYTDNCDRIGESDVVLIDAGCEFRSYAGDITRSFPANGRFSPAQRDIYQAVLDVQLQAVDEIRPGLVYSEIQSRVARRLTQAMVDLGLLSGDPDELFEGEAYKRYYMHGAGHWLGIDVHDVGSYYNNGGTHRPLEASMTLTIEPGIYVPKNDEDAPEAFRGIGVRIEDDVLVTEHGYENLTSSCPKTIDEIEAIVGTEA